MGRLPRLWQWQLQVGSLLMGVVAARIIGAFGWHGQMLLSAYQLSAVQPVPDARCAQ
jgi:hypothetical protein